MNFTRLINRAVPAWLGIIALAVSLLFGSEVKAAGLSFTVSPAGGDNRFVVGETVRFDVFVSGIESGQQIDSLSSTLSFDSEHFEPALLIVGPIIPDPLESESTFNGAAFTGLVDVFYQTTSELNSQYITENGLFFTLEVNVLAEGSGNLFFDFTDATESTISDFFQPVSVESTGLSYVIVPEPPVMGLFLLGTFILGGALFRKSMKR